MDLANCSKKRPWFAAKRWTSSMVSRPCYWLSNRNWLAGSSANRFWSPPDLGHRPRSSAAYAGFSVLSTCPLLFCPYSLCLKLTHRESPMVCPPESATRSTTSSPWLANLPMMVGSVSLGAGMRLFEPLRLAVSESLLPSGTSHPGPPVCSSSSSSSIIIIISRFSVTNLPLPSASRSTEASQPWTKQSWKWRRSRDAAMRGSSACAFATMAPTMDCSCGHKCGCSGTNPPGTGWPEQSTDSTASMAAATATPAVLY
nr:unnamed protein product [Digitaria exilis]